MQRKTAIILIISAVALLAIGFAVFYFFFFRGQEDLPPDATTFPKSGEVGFEEEKPTVLEETREDGSFKPILRQLSTTPVAGAVIGGKESAVVRYIDTATGNVMEIPPAGGETKRLTNTTIPKVYEALWNKTGNGVILRYLKDDTDIIQTYSARLKSGTSGAEGELQGTFLPNDIIDLTLSPNTDEVFYIREEKSGTVGIRSLFSGSGRSEIWRSPTREWLTSWPTTNSLFLTTKASVLARGMAVRVDRSSGAEEVLLREVFGLTTLPGPKARKVLYSESTGSGINLYIHDISKKSSELLSLATFPEKCVWSLDEKDALCGVPTFIREGSYPDSWYQGVVSFSDSVWSISAENGASTLVSDLSETADRPLDLIRPILSVDEKFLIFINKTDGTLWSLQLKP